MPRIGFPWASPPPNESLKMSKSLARVAAALAQASIAPTIVEMAAGTHTAEDAARAAGCMVDQIAKSIVFQGRESGRIALFITAGGNRVDPERAGALAGEPLGKADADLVRATTGFAIGGVAPIGHLTPPLAFFDRRLLDFPGIWAAAGTPRHVFAIVPADLLRISGAALADFTG